MQDDLLWDWEDVRFSSCECRKLFPTNLVESKHNWKQKLSYFQYFEAWVYDLTFLKHLDRNTTSQTMKAYTPTTEGSLHYLHIIQFSIHIILNLLYSWSKKVNQSSCQGFYPGICKARGLFIVDYESNYPPVCSGIARIISSLPLVSFYSPPHTNS